MNSVQLLESAIETLRRAGYTIRREWMVGQENSVCTIRGRKLIFLDQSCQIAEQLDFLIAHLGAIDAPPPNLPVELEKRIELKRAA